MPAPPMANLPRCTRCQSVGAPSTAAYCDIGDTTMRLRAVSPRTQKGRNSTGSAPVRGSLAFTASISFIAGRSCHGGGMFQALEQRGAPHVLPRGLRILRRAPELVELLRPHRAVALLEQTLVGDGLRLDVLGRGVPALPVVEIERLLAGLAAHHAGKLVRQADRIVDPAVHAHAADRIVDVRRVAGEQDPAL